MFFIIERTKRENKNLHPKKNQNSWRNIIDSDSILAV